MIDVHSQFTVDAQFLPGTDDVIAWVSAAAAERANTGEVAVRFVDEEEGLALNAAYRGADKATNVLSFAGDLPAEVGLDLFGDIVICTPVVVKEAQEQGKTIEAHYAHLIVHGTLHLLGFDHEDDPSAQVMEGLERNVMADLGYSDPYASPP